MTQIKNISIDGSALMAARCCNGGCVLFLRLGIELLVFFLTSLLSLCTCQLTLFSGFFFFFAFSYLVPKENCTRKITKSNSFFMKTKCFSIRSWLPLNTFTSDCFSIALFSNNCIILEVPGRQANTIRTFKDLQFAKIFLLGCQSRSYSGGQL